MNNKKDGKKVRGYHDILYEVKDQVAWITINRPRVMNAFREQTLDEMIDAFKSTREDPSIACAVVTGAGEKSFSAGGDFFAMKRLNWINASMWNDRMQGLAMTIRGLPIPVIAMVNGFCMGGGHELALWCDLVIASEDAILGQTGATVGACPTVGATQYLPRIIGERRAREMIFLARRFTGKEAVEILRAAIEIVVELLLVTHPEALEVRLAAFEEGIHAFQAFLGPPDMREQLHAMLPGRVKLIRFVVEALLGHPQGLRAMPLDRLAPGQRFFQQILFADAFID